jgi:hypothetical protein
MFGYGRMLFPRNGPPLRPGLSRCHANTFAVQVYVYIGMSTYAGVKPWTLVIIRRRNQRPGVWFHRSFSTVIQHNVTGSRACDTTRYYGDPCIRSPAGHLTLLPCVGG